MPDASCLMLKPTAPDLQRSYRQEASGIRHYKRRPESDVIRGALRLVAQAHGRSAEAVFVVPGAAARGRVSRSRRDWGCRASMKDPDRRRQATARDTSRGTTRRCCRACRTGPTHCRDSALLAQRVRAKVVGQRAIPLRPSRKRGAERLGIAIPHPVHRHVVAEDELGRGRLVGATPPSRRATASESSRRPPSRSRA